MQGLKFSYQDTCGLSERSLNEHYHAIEKALMVLSEELKKGYNTPYASLSLVQDTRMHEQIIRQAEHDRDLAPAALVIVGIGGSNLGAMAVEQALHGALYNQYTHHTRVYYVDTIAPDDMVHLIEILDHYWQSNKLVIINVISKSGTTVETLVNFAILHDRIFNHEVRKNHTKCVITTDEGSQLWNFALAHSYTCLPIPSLVGGRYSVFSAVGLYPLAILGIPINSLLKGARAMLQEAFIKQSVEHNILKQRVAILCSYADQKMPIHDTFIGDPDLHALGLWYRQLMAESLGKKYDREGKVVRVGMLPTVSMGTVDLHSVAQLYFAGPSIRCTTFLMVEKSSTDGVVPAVEGLFPQGSQIEGKTVSGICNAIYEGVKNAYHKQNMPYMTVTLPQKNAYTIGQLLQMYMIEVMIMGYVINIDPFNQPEVELYKNETRKILSHE